MNNYPTSDEVYDVINKMGVLTDPILFQEVQFSLRQEKQRGLLEAEKERQKAELSRSILELEKYFEKSDRINGSVKIKTPQFKFLFSFFDCFVWFFGQANQKALKQSRDDVKRDIGEMRAENRSEIFIACVVFCRLIGNLL